MKKPRRCTRCGHYTTRAEGVCSACEQGTGKVLREPSISYDYRSLLRPEVIEEMERRGYGGRDA